MIVHSCTSFSKLKFAFAGLVEGSLTGGLPVAFKILVFRYFSQISCALPPFENTCAMRTPLKIGSKFAGATAVILASLEPFISHDVASVFAELRSEK